MSTPSRTAPWALGAALVLAGCRAPSTTDREDNRVSLPDDVSAVHVKFASSLVRHPDHLEIHYRIENAGKEDVAVMDQIKRYGVGEAWEYSPDDVYVDLDGDVLQLTKGILPVPEGGDWRDPTFGRADGRLVAPGAWIEETVAVPIPVKVRDPYRREKGPGQSIATKKAMARSVVVAVGVVQQGPGTLFSYEHPAFPEIVSVIRYVAAPVERWQTLLTKRFELSDELPVLDYETHPWP